MTCGDSTRQRVIQHHAVGIAAGGGSDPHATSFHSNASSNVGYYFEVAPIRVQNYSAVLNSVLTNRLTNQLLFGVSYFNQVFHDTNNTWGCVTSTSGRYTSLWATTAPRASASRYFSVTVNSSK